MSTSALNPFPAPSTPYEAAGRGRRLIGWRASPAGPNRAVASGLDTLRNRSRDACRNSPLAAAVIRCWSTSLVGWGIAARPAVDDVQLKAKLTDLWNAWAEVADADGGDFAGLQQTAVRSWLESGEVFARLRTRQEQDGLPVPLQIQLLESDMLPLLDADTYPGMPTGHILRQGIELDRIGRRAAYWFYRSHPGDTPPPSINPSELVRIPAETVAHLYEPTRPGQLRGVPILAPILTQLRNLSDFDDAVLERQKLANLFTLFVVKPMPSGANDVLTGLPYQGTPDEPLVGLEPGTSHELLPGEDVRFSDPPGAGTDYDEFLSRQLRILSAGAGAPFELVFGDVRDVSDRSMRLVVTDFRRGCEGKLWGVLVPRFLAPIRRAWAMAAALGGKLRPTEAEAALLVRWAPQAWPMLHPVQDVQRAKLEVEAGFRSRSSVIAELGEDPDTVDAERAADLDREAALGLQPADDQQPATGKPGGIVARNRLSPRQITLDRRPAPAPAAKGERGDEGPRGPEGAPGQMPKHQWKGTAVRFELEPGKWGPWRDLQGQKGEEGRSGVVISRVIAEQPAAPEGGVA